MRAASKLISINNSSLTANTSDSDQPNWHFVPFFSQPTTSHPYWPMVDCKPWQAQPTSQTQHLWLKNNMSDSPWEQHCVSTVWPPFVSFWHAVPTKDPRRRRALACEGTALSWPRLERTTASCGLEKYRSCWLTFPKDFCSCLFCFHGLLLSVLLICQWKGERGTRSDGRRDGMRERESRERERERERGERERDCVRESYVMYNINTHEFNTRTLPLHPPIPSFFLMSMVFLFAWFRLNMNCTLSLILVANREIQHFRNVYF